MAELLVVETVDDGRPVVFRDPSPESRLAAQRFALEEVAREQGELARRVEHLSESRGGRTPSAEERVEALLADDPALRRLVRGDDALEEEPSLQEAAAMTRAYALREALGLGEARPDADAARRRRVEELTADSPELAALVLGEEPAEPEEDDELRKAIERCRAAGLVVSRGKVA
jgi:hypothetical protein